MMLLFRLGGLLDSPDKVREIAGLDELPVVIEGTGSMGVVRFCLVNQDSKKKLQEWFSQRAVLQT
jgi:hypothetical protein